VAPNLSDSNFLVGLLLLRLRLAVSATGCSGIGLTASWLLLLLTAEGETSVAMLEENGHLLKESRKWAIFRAKWRLVEPGLFSRKRLKDRFENKL
jgi:hypothetical protein